MKKYLAIAGAGLMMIGTAGMAAAATIDIGGEVRIRYENRDALSFDEDLSDNVNGTTQRTRVNVNAKINDEISAFIQLQNVRTWGGTLTTIDNDTNTDTHQAYLQVNKVFGTPLAVRLGRQELSYGDERLIGNLNWNQVGRSFDAAKVMYKSTDIDVDVFSAKIDENTAPANVVGAAPGTGTTSGNDKDADFYGVWATYKGLKNNTIDAYALLYRDGGSTAGVATTFNGINYGAPYNVPATDTSTDSALEIWTIGAKLKGVAGGFDYNLEYDYQTGKAFNGNDIESTAYAVVLGYTLPVDMSPRLSVEYVFADGDDNTTDNDTETFNQLFPTGHRHLGYADLVGFQNVEAWRFGASIKPTKALSIQADYWNFKLAEEHDAWYRASGGVVLQNGNTNREDDLGGEVDVIAKYKYADNLSLEAGYSLFLAGDITDVTGGTSNFGQDDDQQWVYGMVTLTF